MTTSSIDERVITSRAMDLIMANEGEIQRLERELAEKRAEIERLRQQVTQRGARMQVMREWMIKFSGPSKTIWWYFRRDTPDAFDWFDADGVPK